MYVQHKHRAQYYVTLPHPGPYDDVSRVGVVELEKPKGFQYEAGQYMVINLPWIGELLHTLL